MSSIIVKMNKEQKGDLTDWANIKWEARDYTRFPYFMTEFKNQTFKHVYETNQEYVDFMKKITEATGIFKAFQEYCQIREPK
jgi:hypothetical protein